METRQRSSTVDPNDLIKTQSVYVYRCTRCQVTQKFDVHHSAAVAGWTAWGDAAEEHGAFLLCPGDSHDLEVFLGGGQVDEVARHGDV